MTIRNWKFLYQRLTRGWDDSETWSLDYSVAKFMLPRLIRFKEITNSSVTPTNLPQEEWNDILDSIIYSLEYAVCQFDIKTPEQLKIKQSFDMEKVNDGFCKLGEHFLDLWF